MCRVYAEDEVSFLLSLRPVPQPLHRTTSMIPSHSLTSTATTTISNCFQPSIYTFDKSPSVIIMNNFIERFSTTNPISQLRRAQRLAADDGEEFSDAAWGSEAGFGNLTKGLLGPVNGLPSRRHVKLVSTYIVGFPST
jgi:hypothetical protein